MHRAQGRQFSFLWWTTPRKAGLKIRQHKYYSLLLPSSRQRQEFSLGRWNPRTQMFPVNKLVVTIRKSA